MHDTVLVDIDTQIDFLLPAGSLYVSGAERIIPELARLHSWAAANGVPVISSADAHTDQDVEFQTWPPHCIAGTLGQKKVAETLLPGAVTIPNRKGDLPAGWQNAPQVTVEKQTVNLFDTVTIGRVLEGWPARRYLLCGVVTEICVLNAALGLLRAGHKIELETAAMAALDPEAGRRAIEKMRS